MVEKEPTQEFTMPGLEAMTLKIWRNSRHSLELNRLIARRTKILIGLAAVAGLSWLLQYSCCGMC